MERPVTVRQLIEALSRCPNPAALVILQSDAEGNGFSPLRDDNDVSVVEAYVADSTYSGQVHADWQYAPAGWVPCITLVPIN